MRATTLFRAQGHSLQRIGNVLVVSTLNSMERENTSLIGGILHVFAVYIYDDSLELGLVVEEPGYGLSSCLFSRVWFSSIPLRYGASPALVHSCVYEVYFFSSFFFCKIYLFRSSCTISSI